MSDNSCYNLEPVNEYWIPAISKRYLGKVYYYNQITGESVWHLSEVSASKGRLIHVTSDVGQRSFPEPLDPPFQSSQIINNTNFDPSINLSPSFNKQPISLPQDQIRQTRQYSNDIWEVPPPVLVEEAAKRQAKSNNNLNWQKANNNYVNQWSSNHQNALIQPTFPFNNLQQNNNFHTNDFLIKSLALTHTFPSNNTPNQSYNQGNIHDSLNSILSKRPSTVDLLAKPNLVCTNNTSADQPQLCATTLNAKFKLLNTNNSIPTNKPKNIESTNNVQESINSEEKCNRSDNTSADKPQTFATTLNAKFKLLNANDNISKNNTNKPKNDEATNNVQESINPEVKPSKSDDLNRQIVITNLSARFKTIQDKNSESKNARGTIPLFKRKSVHEHIEGPMKKRIGLNPNDLRFKLTARRKSCDAFTPNTPEEESPKDPISPIHYDNDVEQANNVSTDKKSFNEKDNSFVEIWEDTDLPKIDVSFLRRLSTATARTDRWYIVVDTNVLLSNLKFINILIKSDPTCRMMVPYQIHRELETQMSRLSHDKWRYKMARRATYYIANELKTKTAVVGQTALLAGDRRINCLNGDDDIINCCLQLIEQGYHVIFITNDTILSSKAESSEIVSFTVEQVKNFIYNKESNVPHKHFKIVIKNDETTQNSWNFESYVNNSLPNKFVNDNNKNDDQTVNNDLPTTNNKELDAEVNPPNISLVHQSNIPNIINNAYLKSNMTIMNPSTPLINQGPLKLIKPIVATGVNTIKKSWSTKQNTGLKVTEIPANDNNQSAQKYKVVLRRPQTAPTNITNTQKPVGADKFLQLKYNETKNDAQEVSISEEGTEHNKEKLVYTVLPKNIVRTVNNNLNTILESDIVRIVDNNRFNVVLNKNTTLNNKPNTGINKIIQPVIVRTVSNNIANTATNKNTRSGIVRTVNNNGPNEVVNKGLRPAIIRDELDNEPNRVINKVLQPAIIIECDNEPNKVINKGLRPTINRNEGEKSPTNSPTKVFRPGIIIDEGCNRHNRVIDKVLRPATIRDEGNNEPNRVINKVFKPTISDEDDNNVTTRVLRSGIKRTVKNSEPNKVNKAQNQKRAENVKKNGPTNLMNENLLHIKRTINNNKQKDIDSVPINITNTLQDIIKNNNKSDLQYEKSNKLESWNVADDFDGISSTTEDMSSIGIDNISLNVFDLENEHLDDRIRQRSDEFVSCFVQVMEDAMTQVLQMFPLTEEMSPPPWNLREAINNIKISMKQDNTVHVAASIFSDTILKNWECIKSVRKEMPPLDYMIMFNQGVQLVKALKEVFSNNEDIITAEATLYKMIMETRDIKDKNYRNLQIDIMDKKRHKKEKQLVEICQLSPVRDNLTRSTITPASELANKCDITHTSQNDCIDQFMQNFFRHVGTTFIYVNKFCDGHKSIWSEDLSFTVKSNIWRQACELHEKVNIIKELFLRILSRQNVATLSVFQVISVDKRNEFDAKYRNLISRSIAQVKLLVEKLNNVKKSVVLTN